jgi:hypothetical protein
MRNLNVRRVLATVLGIAMMTLGLVAAGPPASAASRRCRFIQCRTTTTVPTTTSTPTTATTTTVPTTTTTRPTSGSVAQMLAGLKLVNYYPTDAGWTLMWTKFPASEMNSDFAGMRAMGANSVRIILQVSTIGYPTPSATMLGELAQIVSMAHADGLTVQLTLFDWFGGYTEIANSTGWAKAVLAPFKNDPRISFVELKNEVDVTSAAEMSWAATMLPIVKTDVGTIPVTLSLPGNAPAGALATVKADFPSLDFYDVHDYGSVTSQLSADKALVAPAPLYVGEAGHSTRTGGSASTASAESSQASFFTSLNTLTKQLGIPLASPWAWQDFQDGTLTWVAANSSEYGFGLLRIDGTQKPAFAVEKAAFQGP